MLEETRVKTPDNPSDPERKWYTLKELTETPFSNTRAFKAAIDLLAEVRDLSSPCLTTFSGLRWKSSDSLRLANISILVVSPPPRYTSRKLPAILPATWFVAIANRATGSLSALFLGPSFSPAEASV